MQMDLAQLGGIVMPPRIASCFLLVVSLIALTSVTFAAADATCSGKVLMVVENQLTVGEMGSKDMRHFDISAAAIYKNGLPASSAALAMGDWVTVTSEMQDGRLVAMLVEAGSNR